MEYRGSGRPIQRDSDIASLDIPAPRPDVEVSDAELARRLLRDAPRSRR